MECGLQFTTISVPLLLLTELCPSVYPAHRPKELEFWEVAEDLVSECCWKTYQASKTSKRIIDHIDHSLSDPFHLSQNPDDSQRHSLATRIWLSLERPQHSFRAKMWNSTYVMFMMLSIAIFALETVDSFRGPSHHQHLQYNASCLTPEELELFSEPLKVLHYLDITCNIFFTLEPLVRLATCPNKLIFLTGFLNIIDLVLIVSMWVGLALEDIIVPSIRQAHQGHVYLLLVMRAVLALRVLRVLHLTKRFQSMKVMMLSMKASSQELGLLMTVLFMAVLIYGNLVYVAEFIAETHVFKNVPTAVWWALVTLTTVGYGDFYPTSVSGYFIGSACAITGLLLLAMPIAIIATNFSTYYENLASYEQRCKRKTFIRKVLGRDSVFLVKPGTTKEHPPQSQSQPHACLDLTCCLGRSVSPEEEDSNSREEEEEEDSVEEEEFSSFSCPDGDRVESSASRHGPNLSATTTTTTTATTATTTTTAFALKTSTISGVRGE
ncbi:hypothetical protein ACOMHN_053637 [Nucella lapillus]